MKNRIIVVVFLVSLLTSFGCRKDSIHKVSYFFTNSEIGCTVSYLDENGAIQTVEKVTQSKNDKVVVYTCYAESGEIVYMSATDTTQTSFVTARIFIDDKIYKEASRTDNNTMPVIVSGTVPYN